MMSRKCVWSAGSAAAIALVSGAASAATATSTLSVSATVLKSCTVATTPVLFGNYDPTSATAKTGTGSVAVTCTSGTSYDVGLDAGAGTGATVASRKLTLSSNTLNYALYSDSGYTSVWGVTIGTDVVHATAPVSLVNTHTVYGSIPAGQGATLGAYTDTVNVTVTY